MNNLTKASLLIFAVAAIVYSNSLCGEFAWDDDQFVVKNPHIRTLADPLRFFYDPSTVALGDLSKDVYRPLVPLSYAVDFFFWRLNAFGYHLTNLIFHALNGVLVLALAYLIVRDAGLALFAGLFFVCHPVQTEAVSWISGRSSVLFLFFYLWSIILYVRYRERKSSSSLVLSILCAGLSFFSKEMAVTLPFMLMVYDAHFMPQENIGKKVAKYLPYAAFVLIFLAARTVALGSVKQYGGWGGVYPTGLTMSTVVVDYLALLIAPVRLCANYFTPIVSTIGHTNVIVSVAILALIIGGMPFLFKRDKILSFALCWFFVTLLPVLNFIPLKALKAERFLYLPSIGYCLALAVIIDRLRQGRLFRASKVVVILISASIVTVYALRTVQRNEDWRMNLTITETTLAQDPLNPWAISSLGTYYANAGDFDAAAKEYRKALLLYRDFDFARASLGFCYLKLGKFDESIAQFREALRLKPGSPTALNYLGVAYANLKRYDEALLALEQAVKCAPNSTEPYLNLGRVYEEKGQMIKALAQYYIVLLQTKDAATVVALHIRIGDVYLKMGIQERAKGHYRLALSDVSCPEPVRASILEKLGSFSR